MQREPSDAEPGVRPDSLRSFETLRRTTRACDATMGRPRRRAAPGYPPDRREGEAAASS